ncbi:MAG: penicillin-binding protein activator [Desulfovibrio sp.]|uniref:penicillin-binding protein activator n=1 Tax=Desulfovibrio sp. 7SRBS1 TaxID=3378064 RepID=UPI003B3D9619
MQNTCLSLRRTTARRVGLFTGVLLCVLLILVLAGCEKKIIGPGIARPEVRDVSTPKLVQEADDAWQNKDWARSELFYERLLQRPDLEPSVMPLAHQRFTISTLNARHFHRALQACEVWGKAVPQVRLSWAPWYSTQLAAHVALKDISGARLFLGNTMADATLPEGIRTQSVNSLFDVNSLAMESAWEFARFLNPLHAKLPDDAVKARLEADTLTWMESLDNSALDEILQAGGKDNENVFPYSVSRFESAWRKADKSVKIWPTAYRQMRQAVTQGGLYDSTPLNQRLKILEDRYGLPRTGLVLALPLSGKFAAIGWKILKGAGLAQWLMLKQGVEIEVRAVNTDVPGWTDELATLPPSFGAVGGPIRKEAFQAAVKANLTGERPFFTFMPSLGEWTEGQDAWRFFGSPQDQVRSLVRLSVERLGIKDFAIVYPEETFGHRMSEIFWKEAEAAGGQVTGIAGYPPKDPTKWGASVGKLLQVPPKTDSEPSLQQLAAMDNATDYSGRKKPDFQAVFLPDGWAQASILAPQFFFFEEDRMVLLGPALWSQALTSKSQNDATGVEDTYFKLAVCPGAWWPESHTPGMTALRSGMDEAGLGTPDFWIALGFDFVRFATRLGQIPKNAGAAVVNARLANADQMDWSLAPMTWDDEGRASQWYYLFQPHSDGLRVVDPEQLRLRTERMSRLHEQREQIRRQNRINELTGGNATSAAPAPGSQNLSQLSGDLTPTTGAIQ